MESRQPMGRGLLAKPNGKRRVAARAPPPPPAPWAPLPVLSPGVEPGVHTKGINVGLVSWSFLTMALLHPMDVGRTFNPSLGPATEYAYNASHFGTFNDLRTTAQRVSTVHGFIDVANSHPKAVVETFTNIATLHAEQVIYTAQERTWTPKEGYWVRRGVTDVIEIYLAHSEEKCEWTVYKTFADFIDSNLTYGTMVFAEGMMDILTVTSNGRAKGAAWAAPPPSPPMPPPPQYGRPVITKQDKPAYKKWREAQSPPPPPMPLAPHLGHIRGDPSSLLRMMDTRGVFRFSACFVKGYADAVWMHVTKNRPPNPPPAAPWAPHQPPQWLTFLKNRASPPPPVKTGYLGEDDPVNTEGGFLGYWDKKKAPAPRQPPMPKAPKAPPFPPDLVTPKLGEIQEHLMTERQRQEENLRQVRAEVQSVRRQRMEEVDAVTAVAESVRRDTTQFQLLVVCMGFVVIVRAGWSCVGGGGKPAGTQGGGGAAECGEMGGEAWKPGDASVLDGVGVGRQRPRAVRRQVRHLGSWEGAPSAAGVSHRGPSAGMGGGGGHILPPGHPSRPAFVPREIEEDLEARGVGLIVVDPGATTRADSSGSGGGGEGEGWHAHLEQQGDEGDTVLILPSIGPFLPRRDPAIPIRAALRATPLRLLPEFLAVAQESRDTERLTSAPENYMAPQELELINSAAEYIAQTVYGHCVVVALEPGPALGGVDSALHLACMTPLMHHLALARGDAAPLHVTVSSAAAGPLDHAVDGLAGAGPRTAVLVPFDAPQGAKEVLWSLQSGAWASGSLIDRFVPERDPQRLLVWLGAGACMAASKGAATKNIIDLAVAMRPGDMALLSVDCTQMPTVALWPFRDITRGFAENRAKRIMTVLKKGHAPGIDLTSLVYKPRWDVNETAVYEAMEADGPVPITMRSGDAFRLNAGESLTVCRWQKLTEGEAIGAVKQAGLTLKNKWAWRGKVNNMLVSPGMMLMLVQKPQR